MTDKPEIGKTLWNDALVDGRNATNAARRAINRLLDDQPGPQTTSLLIAQIAVQLGTIEAVLSELDRIGRNAKNGTKPKQQRTLKTE